MDHERPVAEVDPRGGRWVYEKGASKDAGTAGSSLKGRISGWEVTLGIQTPRNRRLRPCGVLVIPRGSGRHPPLTAQEMGSVGCWPLANMP
ncbi:hypothetical protein VCV18_000959 [Metarhizium anisopliae]